MVPKIRLPGGEPLVNAARRWWVRWWHSPHRLWVVLVAAMLLAQERVFPLSDFPMYGDFPDRTYYVYIADEEDRPLPLFELYGYRTTFLKRVYNRKLKGVVRELEKAGEEAEEHLLTPEDLRPAGTATLRWLVESDRRHRPPEEQPRLLRLKHVVVIQEGDQLVRRVMDVGEVQLREAQ